MAEDKTPDYTSFEKYMLGALATEYLRSEENARLAPHALETLAGSKGLNMGEEAEGFIKGTQASEEGLRTAASVYGRKFYEQRDSYSPKDLMEWYTPLFEGLEDEDKQKIIKVLNSKNESIKDIRKKFKRADKALKESKDPDFKDLYSPKQIESAEKDMKKYEKVILVMEILDNYKFEQLRPDVIDSARKRDLKGLASKL